MGTFRHAFVDAVLAGIEAGQRADRVKVFVDEQVRRMPFHLRLGVLGTERFLAATSSRAKLAERVEEWASSRLPPVAAYARLVRGLTLFSAFEFAEYAP